MAEASRFVCEDTAGIVYVDDPENEEAREDEEFVRCTLLRFMNIRVTSSALMESSPFCPPLLVFHWGKGWKLGGDATAVICITMLSVGIWT